MMKGILFVERLVKWHPRLFSLDGLGSTMKASLHDHMSLFIIDVDVEAYQIRATDMANAQRSWTPL